MTITIKTLPILTKLRLYILRRTKSGIDYKNQPFKPYTRKYARAKGSSKVDLTLTGQMLNSVGINLNQGLYMNNPLASNKQIYNASMGRLFMGLLTHQLIEIVLKLVYSQITKQLLKEFNKWNIR